MIAIYGRIQWEGEVVHLVANRLTDMSAQLAGVGERDENFLLPQRRGDDFHHGSTGADPRDLPPKGLRTRDIYVRDVLIDSIKLRARDFR